jgi:hypothetical protein
MADFNPAWANSIASIESGGAYDKLGPYTNKGDRAYGKYQVMGENIPEWTNTHLGKRMSPEEFLANPEAQDKVFQSQFGSYVDRFGNPQDAASAWFTGQPLSRGANRKDVLGTSGQSYVDKFNAGLSGNEGVAAINKAAPQASAAPGATAFATVPGEDAGALSTDQRLGSGALTAADRMGFTDKRANALIGMGASLAGISSPEQANSLNAQLKDRLAAQAKQESPGSFSVHVDPKTGKALRINNKTGQVLPFSAFTPTEVDKGTEKYQEARAKANSDLYDKIGTDQLDASAGLANVSRMRQALADPNVYQGNGGEAYAAVKGYAKSLGFDISGVENSQLATSLHNQLTLAARKVDGMPGSLSDSDRNFLSAIAPGLNNRPETNTALMDMMGKMYQRKIEIAKMRDDYVAENGKLDDGFTKRVSDFVSKNNLFDAKTSSLKAPAFPKGVRSIEVITP